MSVGAIFAAVVGFFRSLTWRQILLGAATLGAFLLYEKGRRDQRKEQQIEDLEGYVDVRREADEAKQDAARRVGSMSDDELNDGLREHDAIRD